MKTLRFALMTLILVSLSWIGVEAQLNCSGGNCPLAASALFSWVGRSVISSTADGQVSFQNNAQSAYANLNALSLTVGANNNATITQGATGVLRLNGSWDVNAAGNLVAVNNAYTISGGTTVTAGITSTTTITTAALQMRGNAVLLDGTPACTGAGCVMGTKSTNTAMNMTTTTTGASDITVTFSTAFANPPSCFANNDTTGNISRVTTVVVGSIHVQGVTVAGDTLRVGCFGN